MSFTVETMPDKYPSLKDHSLLIILSGKNLFHGKVTSSAHSWNDCTRPFCSLVYCTVFYACILFWSTDY